MIDSSFLCHSGLSGIGLNFGFRVSDFGFFPNVRVRDDPDYETKVGVRRTADDPAIFKELNCYKKIPNYLSCLLTC